MSDQEISILTRKYISNQCTVNEVRLLFQLIGEGKYDQILKGEIDRVKWDSEEEVNDIKFPAFTHVFGRLFM